MTQFIVQGTFDSSTNQLLINFNNVPQLSNNQGSPVSPVLQQSTFIRKPSPHFYTSTLGLAGGVGLLVSCVWSVLLPAIGSVGVMAFAYLVNKKITSLHAKELSQDAAKSHNAFTQQLGSGKGSGNLLDGTIDTSNLPPPILPMSNIANQSNIPLPPPMPGSGNLIGESANSDIPIPPPLPSAPPMPLKQEEENQKTDSTKPNSKGFSNELIDVVRNGRKLKFSVENAEKTIKKNPEDYPSTLLLEELKTTYKRALDISKSEDLKDWEKYFANKVEKFDEDFPVKEQIEEQTSQCMKSICEKTKDLDSILKNMQWVKSLLCVLSERKCFKDLSNKSQKHCSEKLKNIDKHIRKLQSQNGKKSEEVAGSSTRKANSLEIQDSKSAENGLDVASILARRPAMEYSDSSSSSENESDDETKWDD